jgi:hypothetical protein
MGLALLGRRQREAEADEIVGVVVVLVLRQLQQSRGVKAIQAVLPAAELRREPHRELDFKRT